MSPFCQQHLVRGIGFRCGPCLRHTVHFSAGKEPHSSKESFLRREFRRHTAHRKAIPGPCLHDPSGFMWLPVNQVSVWGKNEFLPPMCVGTQAETGMCGPPPPRQACGTDAALPRQSAEQSQVHHEFRCLLPKIMFRQCWTKLTHLTLTFFATNLVIQTKKSLDSSCVTSCPKADGWWCRAGHTRERPHRPGPPLSCSQDGEDFPEEPPPPHQEGPAVSAV